MPSGKMIDAAIAASPEGGSADMLLRNAIGALETLLPQLEGSAREKAVALLGELQNSKEESYSQRTGHYGWVDSWQGRRVHLVESGLSADDRQKLAQIKADLAEVKADNRDAEQCTGLQRLRLLARAKSTSASISRRLSELQAVPQSLNLFGRSRIVESGDEDEAGLSAEIVRQFAELR